MLWGVDGTGENHNLSIYDPNYVEGLSGISISALKQGSPRLWAHWVASLAATVIVCWRLFVNRNLMKKYFIKELSMNKPEHFAIMVREIKEKTDEELKERYEKIYPGKVREAHIVQKCEKEWKKELGELNRMISGLEKAEWAKENKPEKGPPKHKENKKLMFFGGEEVESIPFYTENIPKKREIVNREIKDRNLVKPCNVGFVVFNNISTAQQAIAQNHGDTGFAYVTKRAPGPDDVLWGNLQQKDLMRFIKTGIVNAVVIFLVFFWTIPVMFLSQFSNMETLKLIIPGIDSFIESISPAALAFLEGFLPTLVIIVFFALLVMILTILSSIQGLQKKSILTRSVLNKYYLFLVINLFLGSTVGAFVREFLTTVVTDPSKAGSTVADLSADEIIKMLGDGLPPMSFFFINYITVLCFLTYTMKLLRPAKIIVPIILKKLGLAKTERDFLKVESPGFFPYHKLAPKELLVFQLAVTYLPISSYITIPAACFFFVVSFVSFYNFVFVHPPAFRGKGIIFVSMWNRMLVSTIIGQVTLFALLSGKESGAAALMIINIFILLAFWMFCTRFFGAVEAMGDIHEVEANMAPEYGESGVHESYLYIQPELRKEEYRALYDQLPYKGIETEMN